MSLYQKHRPKTFDEVVGNENTVQVLQKFCADADRPHSYLFSGPPGTGKTTCARVFAKEIGTLPVAIREINMSETRGIDTVREIIEQSKYPPLAGPHLVWVLDEAHGVTTEAANSILKILEDTPDWIYFVLCTTEPDKINKAIRSRCSPVSFSPVPDRSIRKLIQTIGQKEGVELDPEVIKTLAFVSEGIPRIAIVLLEAVSLIGDANNQITFLKERAYATVEDNNEVIDLLRKVLKGGSVWKEASVLLASLQKQGVEPERIRRAALSYLSKVLLGQYGKQAIVTSKKMYELIEPTFNTGFAGLTNQIFRAMHME